MNKTSISSSDSTGGPPSLISGSVQLADTEATEAWGARLAEAAAPGPGKGGIIYLSGDLGAGKTTLVRGVMRGLGHQGAVKSPTYTLVEPYERERGSIYHFDLYRLEDPEEVVFLGVDEYFAPDNLCLIEWPGQGRGFLPAADLHVDLRAEGAGRQLVWRAGDTAAGRKIGQRLIELAAQRQ